MGFVRELIHKIKAGRTSEKNEVGSYLDRELDIGEILSRESSDNIVIDAHEYCMRKCGFDTSKLDDGYVKDFVLCNIFAGEVDNGGLRQFFSNSSGDMSKETLAALGRINAQCAGILDEAMACFPDGNVPKDCELRNEIMDTFDDKANERLDEFDRRFYDQTELNVQLYDYLMEHKNEFMGL